MRQQDHCHEDQHRRQHHHHDCLHSPSCDSLHRHSKPYWPQSPPTFRPQAGPKRNPNPKAGGPQTKHAGLHDARVSGSTLVHFTLPLFFNNQAQQSSNFFGQTDYTRPKGLKFSHWLSKLLIRMPTSTLGQYQEEALPNSACDTCDESLPRP